MGDLPVDGPGSLKLGGDNISTVPLHDTVGVWRRRGGGGGGSAKARDHKSQHKLEDAGSYGVHYVEIIVAFKNHVAFKHFH